MQQSTSTSQTDYSIWLIPPPDVAANYERVIKQLSDQLSGPVFAPHLTILGDLTYDLDQLILTIGRFRGHQRLFRISALGLQSSPEYFRALFVAVQLTSGLQRIRSRIVTELSMSPDIPFEPHLSLAYGHLDPDTRSRLVTEISVPERREFFAWEIVIARSSKRLSPDAWEILHRVRI